MCVQTWESSDKILLVIKIKDEYESHKSMFWICNVVFLQRWTYDWEWDTPWERFINRQCAKPTCKAVISSVQTAYGCSVFPLHRDFKLIITDERVSQASQCLRLKLLCKTPHSILFQILSFYIIITIIIKLLDILQSMIGFLQSQITDHAFIKVNAPI